MKTIFSTFPSGCGDCLFIVIKDEDGGSQYSIMTDCGSLTDDIKSYIRNELQMTIDMLIVHILMVIMLMVSPNYFLTLTSYSSALGKFFLIVFSPNLMQNDNLLMKQQTH